MWRRILLSLASQFGLGIDEAYDNLNCWDTNLDDIDENAHQLRELQELFDLNPSDFKELKDCRCRAGPKWRVVKAGGIVSGVVFGLGIGQ